MESGRTMRWTMVLLLAMGVLWASVEVPEGGGTVSDPGRSNPEINQSGRAYRPFRFTSAAFCVRVFLNGGGPQCEEAPEPQKPVRIGNETAEAVYKAYPLEPFQHATVTVYTF